MTTTDRELGFLIGLIVGEAHIGGDNQNPQMTIRMHVRHEGTIEILRRILPGGRLYGPYTHDGRTYLQWMARGTYLRTVVVPLLYANADLLDDHIRGRLNAMCARYRITNDSRETNT
jgi:hypothetical protein